MTLTRLTAISPIDGRYGNQTEKLQEYFSEAALIRYRVRVEIDYLIALAEIPLPQMADFPADDPRLPRIYTDFSLLDAQEVKTTEKITNHDVKAVEYFVKNRLEQMGLGRYVEMVHLGLTSQDINNTATPLLLKEAMHDVVLPEIGELTATLRALSVQSEKVPMLAHTHGQPASPTRLGKEIQVFIERLEAQLAQLLVIPHSAKFGGATGNFNAHHVAYPQIDWVKFGNQFVNEKLGLHRSQTTTQIEHYDNFAAYCDAMKRINNILLDFSRDIWAYISMNYFKQKIKEGEVGSSAMPHKVNPIDFENAEGNLGMANALFEHFAAKLPISRLQRDLSDSTVLRNVGVPVGHSLIALKSLQKGLGKLVINTTAIDQDLEDNWAVVAEAIQTILRRVGYPKPYEALKALTRTGGPITKQTIAEFIHSLDISNELKAELLIITPQNYTGI